jgi:hypothetical protein
MQTAAEGQARLLGLDHPDTLASARMLEQMRDANRSATAQAEEGP